jgi:hypothetical protein
METIGTNDPVKSSSQSVGIDWPVLTYWVTYLSIVSGIFYPELRKRFKARPSGDRTA